MDIQTIPPPSDIELERSVLSACILAPAALDHCIEKLVAETFYDQRHRILFDAFLALYEKGTPLDPVTIKAELDRNGTLEGAGGITYMFDVVKEVATAANIRIWARQLHQLASRRVLRTLGANLQEKANDPSQTPAELIEGTEEEFRRLTDDYDDGFRSIGDVLSGLVDEIEDNRKQGGRIRGYSSGLVDLDEILGGLWARYYILAAGTSQGKTALAIEFTLNVAKAGAVVTYFSLEMSAESLAVRMLSVLTGIPGPKIFRGDLDEREWCLLTRAFGRLANLKIEVDDRPNVSPLQARARCDRLRRMKGLGFIVIDYLQLMSPTRGDSREQEVSSISRGIKALNQEFKVPVLALSQLSREHQKRSDQRPQLHDLRESGSLEQDADVVLFLFHPHMAGEKGPNGESLEGIAEVNVGKQRQGPKGTIHVSWDEETTHFANLAPQHQWSHDEEAQKRSQRGQG